MVWAPVITQPTVLRETTMSNMVRAVEKVAVAVDKLELEARDPTSLEMPDAMLRLDSSGSCCKIWNVSSRKPKAVAKLGAAVDSQVCAYVYCWFITLTPRTQIYKTTLAGLLDEASRKLARKFEKQAWKESLEALKLNPQEVALYLRYKEAVASEIRELRSVLDGAQAKRNERVWLRNRDNGDLDDRRLVDGLTGERNIYKRRGDRPPDAFAFQELPKRMTFLFDVSSSMSRYSMDGRLERSLEAAVMVMEGFKGYEHKFAWRFRGHSGSTDDLVFVHENKYPADDVARLEVLRRMNLHADTCGSGDNTLESTKRAIAEIVKEPADEYFVILFSDANLEQYSIKPSDLKALLEADERVNLYIIFIGSMGQQAQRLKAELPGDRVFVTLSSSAIPGVLKRIFLSSVVRD